MAPKYGQEPKRARLRLEQRPRSASKGMPARLPPNDPSIKTYDVKPMMRGILHESNTVTHITCAL